VTQNGRGSRLLIEGFVIVLSILLAFGIDASWDARAERIEEAEILGGLRREYRGYREALKSRIEQHAKMQSAFTTILMAAEEREWTSAEWDFDEALGELVAPPTSDVGNGVRDALVQAGRLELVSDVVLREYLARWPGVFGEVLDDELFSREIVLAQVLPYLTRAGLDLSSILVGALGTGAAGGETWPIRSPRLGDDPDSVRRLLADPEFKALVQVRYAYWEHAGGEYQFALQASDEILDLLGSQ
jgi:hypothetical protein